MNKLQDIIIVWIIFKMQAFIAHGSNSQGGEGASKKDISEGAAEQGTLYSFNQL